MLLRQDLKFQQAFRWYPNLMLFDQGANIFRGYLRLMRVQNTDLHTHRVPYLGGVRSMKGDSSNLRALIPTVFSRSDASLKLRIMFTYFLWFHLSPIYFQNYPIKPNALQAPKDNLADAEDLHLDKFGSDCLKSIRSELISVKRD